MRVERVTLKTECTRHIDAIAVGRQPTAIGDEGRCELVWKRQSGADSPQFETDAALADSTRR